MIGPEISVYSMLLIAALLGTALRNILRLIGDPLGRFDLPMLLNEAAAGILIAFGFALLYWAAVMGVNGEVPSINSTNFRRFALTMTTLGFAASLLLNEAARSLCERMLRPFKSSGSGGK